MVVGLTSGPCQFYYIIAGWSKNHLAPCDHHSDFTPLLTTEFDRKSTLGQFFG